MTQNPRIAVLTLICAVALIACGGQSAPVAETTAPAAAHQAPAENTIQGTVLETMDAGTYTYVKLDVDGEEVWAAANQFQVAVGDELVVPTDMPMENFHSESLGRDFDLIYFTSNMAKAGDTPVMTGMPAGHPPIDRSAEVTEAMETPAGGITIATAWNDKASLAGQQVTLRGKVVKYNAAILGSNWLHIQDGSGDQAAGTHDLTVTTADTVAVGDVVTVVGTLVVDQDFGAGYAYPVLVKEASITVE